MRRTILAALLIAAASAATAQEASEDDIASRIISVPVPAQYRVDGVRNGGRVRSDAAVQGGKALRIEVPGRREQAWSVSVAVPISQPVSTGDELILALWARLERGEGGATTAELPYNAVQLAREPYTALLTGPMTIGPEWQLHEVARGRADRDYAAGDLNVSLHLATARQIVDVGPVFVLNMAQ